MVVHRSICLLCQQLQQQKLLICHHQHKCHDPWKGEKFPSQLKMCVHCSLQYNSISEEERAVLKQLTSLQHFGIFHWIMTICWIMFTRGSLIQYVSLYILVITRSTHWLMVSRYSVDTGLTVSWLLATSVVYRPSVNWLSADYWLTPNSRPIVSRQSVNSRTRCWWLLADCWLIYWVTYIRWDYP